jgi:Protein of unknown function (DUF3168)
MSFDRDLAAALRTAALADAGVQALIAARFYDDPPLDAVFPYVSLARVENRPADSSGTEAIETNVTLHVWSRYGGRAEALDVIGALREALHDAPLTIAGRKLVYLFASFSDVFRSGDGQTTLGVLRLRALTEPQ